MEYTYHKQALHIPLKLVPVYFQSLLLHGCPRMHNRRVSYKVKA
jgi:hypothetical protein